jgi:branched-subunit amino acid permease
MTTSFGSICFGSLLVAIVQALRALANQARAEGDAGILACIAECILACLASILEYFNKWAFVYVGLYGYSYLEAGKNVMTLFQNRGWEAIVADDLVGNTMFLVSVIVGGLTGCVGLVVAASSDYFDNAGDSGNSQGVAFLYVPYIIIESCCLSDYRSHVFCLVVQSWIHRRPGHV